MTTPATQPSQKVWKVFIVTGSSLSLTETLNWCEQNGWTVFQVVSDGWQQMSQRSPVEIPVWQVIATSEQPVTESPEERKQ